MNYCDPTGSAAQLYQRTLAVIDSSLAAVPLGAAVFTGGVLIGRELERGTAQLAWTQSVSPVRWLTAKLALPALALTAGTGLLLVLRRAALTAAPQLSNNVWYVAGSFDVLGTTVMVLPLLGLAAGALAALLQRRTLPAAGFAGVLILLLMVCLDELRPHLWSTRTLVSPADEGYGGITGELVDEGAVTSTGAHIPDPMCVDDQRCLADHDITGVYREFHPASHFWPLQLVQTATMLALAATIIYITFRILKRRTTT
ncbi:ABC transporter permease [Streptomyces kunmingensis]|uniref:ABC transporter permease n=1 Tax=Streptomyces kunmingensis TaxID=68225 RepID=A0ABU6C6S0_9ACTN|nr:ABC transporter permease [Streptomyces kunmingensis]MEB3960030.1 ABC transporter permease [Streptomyces kunmingensis]